MADGKEATPAKAKAGSGAQENAKMPKGGRKGGTIFPRLNLKQALEYSKKLVSKTAVAPQPGATILAGVFNNAGPEGKVRLSALKQFGLLEAHPPLTRRLSLRETLRLRRTKRKRKSFSVARCWCLRYIAS
jgi:hypothetical protein